MNGGKRRRLDQLSNGGLFWRDSVGAKELYTSYPGPMIGLSNSRRKRRDIRRRKLKPSPSKSKSKSKTKSRTKTKTKKKTKMSLYRWRIGKKYKRKVKSLWPRKGLCKTSDDILRIAAIICIQRRLVSWTSHHMLNQRQH